MGGTADSAESKEVATLRVPSAGIAEDRTNRLQQYNFIFLFSFANGNTGNNALLTAIRAISFITEEFSYAG